MKFSVYKLKRELSYEVFLLPAVILLAVFYIIPMFSTIFYSFTDLSFYKQGLSFNGLQNYIHIFLDQEVTSTLKNTLIYAFSTTIVMNVVAIALAVVLSNKYKLVNLYRMILFSPAVLTPLIIGYIWSYLLAPNEYGLANWVLNLINIPPINWLGDPKTALACLIFVCAWQWMGWCMVIYMANIQTIPEEYYEAAMIDGANSWQKFFRITLPLMVTSITINTVLFMIGGLKVYDLIISTTNGGPGFATESITIALLKIGFLKGQFGYGSSIAVIQFIIIIIIAIVLLKVLNKWESKVI